MLVTDGVSHNVTYADNMDSEDDVRSQCQEEMKVIERRLLCDVTVVNDTYSLVSKYLVEKESQNPLKDCSSLLVGLGTCA